MTSTADTDPVIVLTTVAADVDAESLARLLVDERLAACVNVLPVMTSIYRWKGAVEQDREQQLVIKTTAPRLEALETRLRALHPYEVPEFLVIDIAGGSAAYLEWLGEATNRDS
jgi:periplasmic divalent cation tolerance protein